jgi:hypothetical protein
VLKAQLEARGVVFEEALARCGSSKAMRAEDLVFCEGLRPSDASCYRFLEMPAALEEFVDGAQAAPEGEQRALSLRAVDLAGFVLLVRNLCRDQR